MAKSAKKKKKKKRARRERELTERLRGLGLRKQSAKTVAHTISNVQGQLPESARGGMTELAAKVDDLRGRVSKSGKRRDPDPPATECGGKAAKKKGKKAKKAAEETPAPG